jgi:hypothetical protein
MTATINETPVINSPYTKDYFDEQLGPVLWSYSGPSVNRLLAVQTKAIRGNDPSSEVRNWLLNKFAGVPRGPAIEGREELQPHGGAMELRTFLSLVRNAFTWSMFWAKAENEVRRPATERHAAVARAVYAGLLSPLPLDRAGDQLGYKRSLGLRVTMASVGMAALSNGRDWDSVVMSRPALSAAVGWGISAAGGHLNGLCDRGLLSRQSADVNKFRILDPQKQQRHEAQRYAASMETLLTEAPDQIAAVIQSVTHPAWGYSETLNQGHWLLLLSNVAGLPPEQFGMTPRLVRRLQRTLDQEYLIWDNMPRNLIKILDHLAADPEHGPVDAATGERISALIAFDQAMAKWKEGADKRTAEVMTAREQNRQAYLDLQKRKAESGEKPGGVRGRSMRRSEQDGEDDDALVTSVTSALVEVPQEVATTEIEKVQKVPAETADEKALRYGRGLLERAPVPQSPKSKQQRAALKTWLGQIRGVLEVANMNDRSESIVASAFLTRLAENGYGPSVANSLVAFMMHGQPLPKDLATYLAS